MPKRQNDPIETDKPDVDEDDAMLEEPKDDAFEDDDTSNVSE